MLDLSQNLIIAIVVGPGIAAAIGLAIWFVRRTFHQQDRAIEKLDKEIEKMAVTQKEIGQKLAGVLEREKVLSSELKSGMEKVDLKFENVRLTFKHETDVLRKDMETLATNVDREIGALSDSFKEMKASVGAHDEVVDRDLAEIREWLNGDGTWPSRNNGAG